MNTETDIMVIQDATHCAALCSMFLLFDQPILILIRTKYLITGFSGGIDVSVIKSQSERKRDV